MYTPKTWTFPCLRFLVGADFKSSSMQNKNNLLFQYLRIVWLYTFKEDRNWIDDLTQIQKHLGGICMTKYKKYKKSTFQPSAFD